MTNRQGALAHDEAGEPTTTSTAPVKKGKDWERIFEDPETGLIPLLRRANSPETVFRILQVLVEQLFTRSTDREAREEYRAAIRRLAEAEASRDAVLERAVGFLREMKSERIRRSANGRRTDVPTSRPDAAVAGEPRDVEKVFSDTFLNRFRTFFDIATDGVTPSLWGTPPFVLSQEFANRLIAVVDADIMPDILARMRRMISRIGENAPDDLDKAVETLFSDRKTRGQLAEIWCEVWEEKTTTVRVPDAPDGGSGGLVGKLFGRKDDRPKWMRESTYEEWEAEVDEITARNEIAVRVWSELTEPSENYQAPVDGDWAFLQRIPIRSREGLQKQVTAITQIAVQGTSNAAFDTYQRDKDIDLALLVCCYRYPDTFLGEDGFLSDVMRGYPDKDRKKRFPLTDRYLISP